MEAEEIVIRTITNRPELITLRVNRTTGFQWYVAQCDQGLECSELPYQVRGSALGAGGEQRFQIVSRTPGTFLLRLQLKRAWETQSKEVRIYRIESMRG